MPYASFRIQAPTPTLYLTFDDGPTPGVTEDILNILSEHHAKATFFCIGAQVESHRDLTLRILAEGHSIGNHTYSHLNGWFARKATYLSDIERACTILHEVASIRTPLFRPPFGRMHPFHWRAMKHRWRCIMWDVTSQDFVEELSWKAIEKTVIDNSSSGSIVLLHDSPRAAPRSVKALPGILRHFKEQGFQFQALE